MNVFLFTTGDGSDGNEWDVEGVYSSREAAERARRESGYPERNSDIEEWPVKE